MDKKTSLSYCITVCSELEELTALLNFLQLHIRNEDEIVIQYDSESVTSEVLEYITLMAQIHENHMVFGFPLNGDFSTFKNNLKTLSTKDYIVALDADEIPNINLIGSLGDLLETNPVDLIFVPRINTVDGITEKHVQQWGWKISKLESQIAEKEMDIDGDEYKYLKKLGYVLDVVDDGAKYVYVKYYKPIVNFPDYQTRVYKRTDDITWMNKVHERITGYDNFSNFPAKEEWCMYHHKDIIKQIQQNDMYSKMM